MKKEIVTNHLFEVSWEICNKVGGIHTVVATKIDALTPFVEKHILIGPDVWREPVPHEEFIEDKNLLRSFRLQAAEEGLHIKVGRWVVNPKPIVILVDFTPFIGQKNQIFSTFWESYGLDSLSGGWDYIEPALFGYAAGKVIESFTRYQSDFKEKNIALFHEWMTGCGVLYLKKNAPYIATHFITHATVLGRCIAGQNQPLYDNMEMYDPMETARRFNVVAKHSLEVCSAKYADVFSTVSQITGKECKHFLGKEVDKVTPNGFNPQFVPQNITETRNQSRTQLKKVIKALCGGNVSDNALFVCISGRYEFKNKGIDVFIKALGALNQSDKLIQEVYAFVLVPAGHRGVRKEIATAVECDAMAETDDKITTHSLQDYHNDPVILHSKQYGLANNKEDKVKIIFVPSYLNGDDGLFNRPYYDILSGMDLSVFPSYYEPWGYTPLESVIFNVPTVTTTLAGFGLWIENLKLTGNGGSSVISRDDTNEDEVIRQIAQIIYIETTLSEKQKTEHRQDAVKVSHSALWGNLITHYIDVATKALDSTEKRKLILGSHVFVPTEIQIKKDSNCDQPKWTNVVVSKNIPNKLKHLEELSLNLWWSWNQDAIHLFKSIDKKLWQESKNNPVVVLNRIPYELYQQLENDAEFLKSLQSVYDRFQQYMNRKNTTKDPKIAYFSMEYGLHHSLKIYSGGLGILAGDYLKEASDKNTPMVAVGFYYKYGYFTQKITSTGEQIAEYDIQDFNTGPAVLVKDSDGNPLKICTSYPGRMVYAQIWLVNVGVTELYLLDTDILENQQDDRSITHTLYGGDLEHRLRQEILLGFGGIRALRAVGYADDYFSVYHCNEGHAAFISIERLQEYIGKHGLRFDEAIEVVKSSSLFTTHTPVPAGHDAFPEELLRVYLGRVHERLGIHWSDFLALGKTSEDSNEKFSMSFLACSCSQEVNGVSWLHGLVSQNVLKDKWKGYFPEELHIGYVTNGVHYETWTASEWQEIYAKVFGEKFASHHYDKSCFEGIYKVPDEQIWNIRNILRGKLIQLIKDGTISGKAHVHNTPAELIQIKDTIDENILTIGFARRFATYKRAHLLFRNLKRLSDIVNHPDYPVQFIFAGKAHPADKAGQDLIKNIISISKRPEFIGKIIFIENYDMKIASRMVKGVDIWLNTPTRPLEASGTSGEKAVMNGVMNFSVLDGWWVEGYQPEAGWALPMEATYEDTHFQDELDAEAIYTTIENEIAPKYYERNAAGVPTKWVGYIKNTIAKVASNFTTNRMLIDYEERFYGKLTQRYNRLIENNFSLPMQIAQWKTKVAQEWQNIRIVEENVLDNLRENIILGSSVQLSVKLAIGNLEADDIGVELVIAESNHGQVKIVKRFSFEPIAQSNKFVTYQTNFQPNSPGNYISGLRIFAQNKELPHRFDFNLVRWI